MNFYKIALALFFILPITSFADDCAKPNLYKVKNTSFTNLSVLDAVKKISDNTPFNPQVDGVSEVLVSASNISGDFDQVLSKLLKQAGFEHSINNCLIKITPIKPPEFWVVKRDEPLISIIETWQKKSGYTVDWNIPDIKQFVVQANATFEGSFEEAIKKFIPVLNGDKPWIIAHIHNGNKMIVFTSPNGGDLDTRQVIVDDTIYIPVKKEEVKPLELPVVQSSVGSTVIPTAIPLQPIEVTKKVKHIEATERTYAIKFEENKLISESLTKFLADNGWDIEWNSAQDFTPKKSYTINGNIIDDVLLRALTDYSLSANLNEDNRVVEIFPAKFK